jgi:hypothetical protein
VRDPDPENIAGEKVQKHVFKHEIQWGYVALAVVAVAVVWKVGPSLLSDSEPKDEDPPLGTEV